MECYNQSLYRVAQCVVLTVSNHSRREFKGCLLTFSLLDFSLMVARYILLRKKYLFDNDFLLNIIYFQKAMISCASQRSPCFFLYSLYLNFTQYNNIFHTFLVNAQRFLQYRYLVKKEDQDRRTTWICTMVYTCLDLFIGKTSFTPWIVYSHENQSCK